MNGGLVEPADLLAGFQGVVLDCRFVLADPGAGRRLYDAGHIPGATFMDLAGFNAPDAPLPSTMPDAAHFAAQAERLGLRSEARIVLYDDAPHRTAARA